MLLNDSGIQWLKILNAIKKAVVSFEEYKLFGDPIEGSKI
jgi:hypothetical protein